jgi:hypothetical protein
MRRRLAIGLLLAAAALAIGPSAGADAPGKQGWWTATGALGLPGTVVAPDVPADGLLLEGGPSTPRSYAAISASLPVGSALVLDVAPNSVTTADVPLQVCPLVSPSFEPKQGGSLADAPEYDCAQRATVVPALGRYRLDLGAMAPDGAVAIALLPVGAADRVVLVEPAVEAGLAASPGVDDIAPLSSFDSSGSLPTSPSYDLGPAAAPAVPPPAAAPRIAPSVSPSRFVPVAVALPEDADPVVVALTLLVGAVGAALWFGARHAARAAVASTP